MDPILGNLTPGLRQRSDVIAHYPWRTVIVQNRVDIANELRLLPEWRLFAEATGLIERNILTNADKKYQQIRVGLKYKPHASSVPTTGHASKESQADAVRYLTRLRLADIILSLKGYPESAFTPKREVVVSSPWAAGEILASVKQLLEPFRQAGPQLQMDAAVLNEGDSLVTKHLKKLVKYSAASVLTTIHTNIILVALQVSFFTSGEDDYERFIARHKREMSRDEVRMLNIILGRDLYLLRRPLYMSCHLSVLLAISAYPLTRQGKYAEMDMICDASSIGLKPEIVVRTEGMVWQCILEVAFGRATLENALQTLHGQIPFSEIDSLQLVEDQALRITAPEPMAPDPIDSDTNDEVMVDSAQFKSQPQGFVAGVDKPIAQIDIAPHSNGLEELDVRGPSVLDRDADTEGEEEMQIELEMGQVPQSDMAEPEVPLSRVGSYEMVLDPPGDSQQLSDDGAMNSHSGEGGHDDDVESIIEEEDSDKEEGGEEEMPEDVGPSLSEVPSPPRKRRRTTLPQDEDVVMDEADVPKPVHGKHGSLNPKTSTSIPTRASSRLQHKLAPSFVKPNPVKAVAPPSGNTHRNPRPGTHTRSAAPAKNFSLQEESVLFEPVRHRALTPFMDLIYGDEEESDDEKEIPSKRMLIHEPMDPDVATKHVVKNVELWDAFGEMKVIESMFFTDPDEKAFFEGLLTAARQIYEDGKPLHVSQPLKSIYCIVDVEDFSNMLPRERQIMFSRQNIVLKNFPTPSMTFDRKGLSQVTNLYLPQTIYDLTLPTGARDTMGTADDLIRNAELDPPKPMNSLDNPMPDGPQDGGVALATDLVASKSVSFIPEGALNVQDTGKHRKWGLFATEGAITLAHIDAEGAATVVDVLIGSKAWVTIRPKESFDPCAFADPRQFRRPFELDYGLFLDWFRVHGGIPDDWVVEIVLLTPKTRHFMPPNTLHAAYTFGKTVCYGAHFYALSTLRRTFCGLVFTLVQEKYLTNTSHPPLRLMIRRIVQYLHMNIIHGYHKDDDTHCFDSTNMSMETFEELFSVISIGILSAILDPRTYCFEPGADDNENLSPRQRLQVELYDCNSLPESERVGIIYARGLAYELLDWFVSKYDLTSVDDTQSQMPTTARIHEALAHEAFAIYVARDRTDREGMWAPNVSLEAIRRQLKGLAPPDSVMHQSIVKLLNDHDAKLTPENFNLLYDWKSVRLHARDTPLDSYEGPWDRQKLFVTGQTQLDARNVQWLSSFWTNVKMEKSTSVAPKSDFGSRRSQLRLRTPKTPFGAPVL